MRNYLDAEDIRERSPDEDESQNQVSIGMIKKRDLLDVGAVQTRDEYLAAQVEDEDRLQGRVVLSVDVVAQNGKRTEIIAVYRPCSLTCSA